jgi:CHAT domain-containing protein/tetratricopeptide (TPR) repeat protein
MSTTSGRAAERTLVLLILAGVCAAPVPGALATRAGGESTAPVPHDSIPAASQLVRDGRYRESEAMARRLLAEADRQVGRESNRAADALDVLVVSLFRQGRAGDSELVALAEQTVALRERLTTDQDKDLANSLTNLGNILGRLERHERALGLHERALSIRTRVHGLEHPVTSASLNNLANVHFRLGHFEEAGRLYLQCLTIQERVLGSDHASVAKTLDNLGSLHQETGQYARATEFIERALAIREKILPPDHPELASALTNLGTALIRTGDFDRARGALLRGLRIQETSLGADHPDLAATLSNLGHASLRLGLFEAASESLDRALAIQERAFGRGHSETAETLVHLADIHSRRGRHATARAMAEEAVRLLEPAEGAARVVLARALGVSLAALRGEGRLEPARRAGERAAAILEEVLGPDHPHLAETLLGLAAVATDAQDHQAAGRWLQRSRRIHETIYGPRHPEVAKSLWALARLHLLEGEPRSSLDIALRAEGIERDALRAAIRHLPESEALSYSALQGGRQQLYLASLIALPAGGRSDGEIRAAWDALVRSRAVVLDEVARRHRIARTDSAPETVAGLESYRIAGGALARLMVAGPGAEDPQRYARDLRVARETLETAERVLAARSVAFRRDLMQERVSLADVGRSLPRRTSLVAFTLYQAPQPDRRRDVARYLAFVLGPGLLGPRVVTLGDASEIDPLVERWRSAVAHHPAPTASGGDAEDEYRGAGAALRRAVWDPVSGAVRGAALVLLVADGALHLVNFATLPEDDGRFLLEAGPAIHYLSSERDVTRAPLPPPTRRSLLAVGGPEYDAPPDRPVLVSDAAVAAGAGESTPRPPGGGGIGDPGPYRGPLSTCADFRSLRFARLPSARHEAEEIASMWRERGGTARGLFGVDSSEGVLKRVVPDHDVIHLATHAFFVQDGCAPAGAVPPRTSAPRAEPATGATQTWSENPFVLTGLALAGANHREAVPAEGEDGILTADEITAMDLAGARWVVLSACETGVGRPRAGEGVLGLRRAFEIAGASTLVMSLWNVQDEAARRWMRELYDNRLRGLSTAEAVRQAGLAMVESQRRAGRTTHPYYWGAFVASGAWW